MLKFAKFAIFGRNPRVLIDSGRPDVRSICSLVFENHLFSVFVKACSSCAVSRESFGPWKFAKPSCQVEKIRRKRSVFDGCGRLRRCVGSHLFLCTVWEWLVVSGPLLVEFSYFEHLGQTLAFN